MTLPAILASGRLCGDLAACRWDGSGAPSHPELVFAWWQVLGSNQRRLSRRFYSPSLLTEEPGADQHIRVSMRDLGLPPSAMRPWVPGSVGRAARGRMRNGPRTGAAEATDGAGGSGYADRPPRLFTSDLAFLDSRL